MKRFFFICAIIFSFSFLYAQVQVEAGENQQYENFSWEPVEKAKSYQVNLERLKSDGTWEIIPTEKIKECSVELLLSAGKYRASISTFNVLGKKSSTSEWVRFTILDSRIPYIFPNSYESDNVYGLPVLFINKHKSKAYEHVKFHADSDVLISHPEGYSENTIFVRGKNIFSPNTKMYLVPVSSNYKDYNEKYDSFLNKRKTVPLQIIKRDTKKSGVYVSYDPSKLESGLYHLQAVNYGTNKADYTILVLADRDIEITAKSGFVEDKRFKTLALNLEGQENPKVVVNGKSFTSQTTFTLKTLPEEEIKVKYPFTSSFLSTEIPLAFDNVYQIDNEANQSADLTAPLNGLKGGYYNVTATDKYGVSASFPVLVKTNFVDSKNIIVKKIKSKYIKKTQKLQITVTGAELNEKNKYKLVPRYTKDFTPVPIPLTVEKVKNNGVVLLADAESVPFGQAGLIIESENETIIEYISIDNHYKSIQITSGGLSAEEFLLGVYDETQESISSDVSIMPDKVVITQEPEVFLPYARLTAGTSIPKLSSGQINVDFRLDLDMFNFGIFNAPIGIKYNPHITMGSGDDETPSQEDYNSEYPDLALELNAWLVAQFKYFKPFIGVSAGYNIIDNTYGFNSWAKHDLYASAVAGSTLLEFFELRLNITFHDLLGTPVFEPNVLFGIRIPLRQPAYARQVRSSKAIISKDGNVDGSEYQDLFTKRVTGLEFNGATSIKNFANSKGMDSLYLPSELIDLEAGAFKDCLNLKNVTFAPNSKIRTIGSQAFANDVNIDSISLPYTIEYIAPDAFANWTENQIIKLSMDPFAVDLIGRDKFAGLTNTKAQVYLMDGKVFKAHETKTLFDSINTWVNHNRIKFKYKEVIYEDKVYSGINLYGSANHSENYSIGYYVNWNIPLVTELIDNNVKEISFKVKGDGHRYIFTVEGGKNYEWGLYQYAFNTRKDVVQEVVINIDKMKQATGSNYKQPFDWYDFKTIQIIPDYNLLNHATDLDVVFFDFEYNKDSQQEK